MKILPQKYCLATHSAAFLMLVWFYLLLLHNCHPPIYLTFCTVLHSATCDSAKGESRVIIQYAIHCRSQACKGSRGTYPQFHEQCSKWIRQTLNTQTEILEDELGKMKYFDSYQWNWKIVFYPHLTNGWRGEAGGKSRRIKNK